MLIPLNLLIKKYNISPKGIIHIGAHMAEEADDYNSCNFDSVIWVEGNSDLIPFLEEKLKHYPSQKVYHALIDIDEKNVVFNITNNLQSSSIFDLKEHAKQYQEIIVEKKVTYKTQRLDSFLANNRININGYNFINLDIQGNELSALKSLANNIVNINYIYTEVQITELYKNSPNLYQMDVFLFSNGFKRVELDLTYKSWGDAFYIRTKENKFYNLKKLIQSRSLVLFWPIRKFYNLTVKRVYYSIKRKIKKS